MVNPDRLQCGHGGYLVNGRQQCRCIICSRCGQHTGNTSQGHFWRYCKVTAGMREHHFCCPANCELES